MKHIKKITLLFLFISAFLVLSPSIISKAATLDPKMSLEISDGATFDANAPMKIRGWGLNSSGIKAIDIYVDSTWKKSLVNGDGFGLSRPDVRQAYPSYPNASNSGYEYNLSLSGISNGSHTLTVWAIGNDGTKISSKAPINVNSSPIVNLELNTKQEAQLNQPVRLRGWALNSGSEGVDTVDIWVKNQITGKSTFIHSFSVNLSRPDVAHLYPNYFNNWTSGYDGYTTFSTKGIYTITAYAMKGSKQLAKTAVTVYAGIPIPPDQTPEDGQAYTATFYTTAGGGFTTKTGASLVGKNINNCHYIAVDPNYIPLNSKVYLDFKENRYQTDPNGKVVDLNGYYTAVDIGGDIKRYRIDVFLGDASYESMALNCGRVTVYVIK